MNDVAEVPFDQLLIKVIDNRGKTCPVVDAGIPLIATNCIKNDKLFPVFEKVRYVNEETMLNWFRGHPKPGDILFVTKGTPGRVAWVPDPVNFCIAQDMVALQVDETKVVPKYLFAALRSNTIQGEIENLHVGSLIPHFKKGDFGRLLIPVPNLDTQKYIGEMYFTLSYKIDLLHRNNKTLEEMAETLFRQWFLDTEFNSTINDVAEVLNGYAFKSSEFSSEGKNYVIKIKNIGGSSVNISDCDRISDNTANKTNNKFKVLSGDVLFAMTGAELGKMGVVGSTTRSLWLNQRVGSIKDRFNGSRYLAYLALNSELGQDFILNTASGSAQPNISGVDISRCPFPSISLEQIEEKSEVLNNLFDKVIHNLGQISILKETRDTLLPKLMSGQVRVKTH